MNDRYYAVTTKCGHVGKGKYVEVTFAVKAENGRDAASIARWIPRVKHHHKDAILNVEELDFDDYLELVEENNQNPYLKCQNIQQQNECCPELEILNCDFKQRVIEKESRINKIEYLKRKNKSIDRELKDYVKTALLDFSYIAAMC